MRVTKRDGSMEPLDISKIQGHSSWAIEGLENVSQSAIETGAHIMFYDGIKTSDIQKALIKSTADLIDVDSPDATYAAARLTLQLIYKEVTGGGLEYPSLKSYIEEGIKEGRLVPELLNFQFEKLDRAIVPERDKQFTLLGIQTIADRYLIRRLVKSDSEKGDIIEMPQHMWMRIAMGLALREMPVDVTPTPTSIRKASDWAIEFYGILSKFEFMNSTPTLFNSGTIRSQLSSCYLNTVNDQVGELGEKIGIFPTITENANLSKYAGGIGTDWTYVRPAGSVIKSTNGISSGVVPYIKIFNDTAIAVNQGGKRNGAFAAYLEPHHADFSDFIDLKKQTGDHRRRAHEVFPAGWFPDLFMERVAEAVDLTDEGEDTSHITWSFFGHPYHAELHDLHSERYEARYIELERAGLAVRDMPIMTLWRQILNSLTQTGAPWITFKDECNRRNPQDHIGVIHSSNLCVAPETKVLTDEGHLEISRIVGKRVNVWNGEEFSSVEIIKTGENKSLVTVLLSNGESLDCTPYHKFYVQDEYHSKAREVRACDLNPGDKMIKFELPIIENEDAPDFVEPYTHGFFCGDGTYNRGKPTITLYDEKKELAGELAIHSGTNIEDASGRLNYQLSRDIAAKFVVPVNGKLRDKLEWFAGFCDADGTIARNGSNESIQAGSINYEFLISIRHMLQTMGVESKVTLMRKASQTMLPDGKGGARMFDTKSTYRLIVSSGDVQRLLELGINFRRLSVQRRAVRCDAHHFVKIVAVEDKGRVDDTYCFTEPKRHMGVFNGVLTGQCTEITLNTSDTETAVCNLGSINLSKVHTVEDFRRVIMIAMRMLDNVIDLNFYPSEKARNSNMKHRPVGLGVMGLTELLVMNGIDWESDENLAFQDSLFERISFEVIRASALLAKERGHYKSYKGSKWDRGILPIDTAAGSKSELNWCEVRELIKKYGMRNSNTMAIAPTATIANITGTTPCIEPIFQRVYTKENKSGFFKIVDPSLKYGRPELCKESFEIDQTWVIKAAAARQKWIDQSQSVNIFRKQGVKGRELSKWYLLAWRLKLKTTYYLRNEQKKETDGQVIVDEPLKDSDSVEHDSEATMLYDKAVGMMCSIDNPDCESCQ